jgi:F-type H+-transporting ATPase subunit b
MHIDWWTLSLQTVNVLVLIWLLKRFLFAPMAAIIETRQKTAAAMLDEARAAKAAAEAARAAIAREASEIVAKREQKLAEAAAEAEAEKAGLISDAHAEAERMRQLAEAEAARLKTDGMKELAQQANALAVDIAGKLLGRLQAASRIDGFIDGFAEAVAALPPESRSALANGDALTISSARLLTAEEQARCLSRLSKAVGVPVHAAFAVDETLIAGVEIRSPYIRVRNSFQADLERISSELGKIGSEH